MDACALATALSSGEITIGQVNSFFTEVPVAEQKAFAEEYGIDTAVLAKTASSLASWSGQQVASVW